MPSSRVPTDWPIAQLRPSLVLSFSSILAPSPPFTHHTTWGQSDCPKDLSNLCLWVSWSSSCQEHFSYWYMWYFFHGIRCRHTDFSDSYSHLMNDEVTPLSLRCSQHPTITIRVNCVCNPMRQLPPVHVPNLVTPPVYSTQGSRRSIENHFPYAPFLTPTLPSRSGINHATWMTPFFSLYLEAPFLYSPLVVVYEK